MQPTATIERPKRVRGTPTENGEFIVYEAVPLFDAHTGDDGVEYDERLLRAIAANCNRRIETTNDWTPVVVAHTRDREDKASVTDDPPVIGLAGPFYVSDFVNSQGEQSKAIYSTFWIFAEDDATFRKNPRRSVEIWPEDRPEARYFDPVSVLGAETPKRDLGLIYSRTRPGHKSFTHLTPGPFRYSKRYSANQIKYQEGGISSVPGGNNTFLPGLGTEKKRPTLNAKGVMPVSPEDLNQIVEALKPTVQAMIDASNAGIGAPADGLPPGLDAPGGAPGLDAPGGPPGLDAPGGAPPLAPVAATPAVPPAAPAADDFSPDNMDDDSKLYARGLGRKFMKYMKDDGSVDDGAEGFMTSLDDDDKKHLGSYMKYMCDNESAKQKYAERYAKSPLGGNDMTEKAGDSKPSGAMNADEMNKGGSPQQYAKLKSEKNDAVQKYAKLNKEHEELKQKYAKQGEEIGKLQHKERFSKRETRLTTLAQDYAFDVEDELDVTSDFNEDQFDRHCSRVIPERYSKVSGTLIPTGAEPKLKTKEDDKSQRYAKQAGDLVQKYRKSGKNVDYGTVMRHLIDTDGQVDEAKLFPSTNGNGKH